MIQIKHQKYLVKTSKSVIPIDVEEIVKVFQSISKGQTVFLKQGAFNPSYFDSIVEDDEFVKKFWEDNKHYIKDGTVTEVPKYDDIFLNLRAEIIKLGNSFKQLN